MHNMAKTRVVLKNRTSAANAMQLVTIRVFVWHTTLIHTKMVKPTKKTDTKSGPKRHQEKAPRVGMSKPSIRRLARRSGAKRVSSSVFSKSKDIVNDFLHFVLKRAVAYNDYEGRKTMSQKHILTALEHIGIPVVGITAY